MDGRVERIEKMEKQIAQLQARVKEEKRKQSRAERDADTHAKVVVGGMVLSHIEGGWKAANFEELAKYFEKYGHALREWAACEELPLEQARQRLRNWEYRHNPWDSYAAQEGASAQDAGEGSPRGDADQAEESPVAPAAGPAGRPSGWEARIDEEIARDVERYTGRDQAIW